MAKVFLSHSTLDRGFVEREIASPLKQHRHRIEFWYSREDVHPTVQWERSILAGMEECDYFLVVMSPRSAESKWVRAEVHWAMERRDSRIIPVLMADCDPLSFHIRMPLIQHIDFRSERQRALDELLAIFPEPSGPTDPVGEIRRFGDRSTDDTRKSVKSVAFSPDGSRALSGSDNGTVLLWDVSAGHKLREFVGERKETLLVAFSPDSRLAIASFEFSCVVIWDAETGRAAFWRVYTSATLSPERSCDSSRTTPKSNCDASERRKD
jgi:hypothetical protein